MQNVLAGQHRDRHNRPQVAGRIVARLASVKWWTAPQREQVQDDVTTGMTIYREMDVLFWKEQAEWEQVRWPE